MPQNQNLNSYPFNYTSASSSGITRAGAGRYPNPFCDIASEYVPRDITAVFEWCTPAGTLIDTGPAGQTCVVEDLRIGDVVFTSEGNFRPIEYTSSRSVDSLLSISLSGMSKLPLQITPEHPVLAWRPVSTLKPFRLVFDRAELAYMPAGELMPGDWVVTPIPNVESTSDFPYSPFICGMYVSEGCLLHRHLIDGKRHARGVRFTLGSHEIKLRDRLVCELTEHCSAVAKWFIPKSRPDVCNIEVFDPELASWLQDNFGEHAATKHLPASLFGLSESDRKDFLGAWIAGDGYISRVDNVVRSIGLYSCSLPLITAGLRLALSCGMTPTIGYRERDNKGFGPPRTKEARLIFNKRDLADALPHIPKDFECTIKDGHGCGNGTIIHGKYLYRKIKAIDTLNDSTCVYNIRVAEDHNYIANNVVVHNCEYMFLTMGTYRAAARRVVRYFLTEMVLEGESDEEREKYNEFLKDDLHIMTELAEIGDDFMVYGNVFVSLYFPFDRFLICPECGISFHASTISFKFNMEDGNFTGECKSCNKLVNYIREDRRSPNKEEVRLIRWNPKQIKLRVHPISGKIEYYLELDPQFVKKLEDGNVFYLNQTPWSMIKCCVASKKNKKKALFRFRDDAIYHFKDSSLAGLPIKGWSIPPIMPNFKLAYYIQILRRYDEAIALDFIIPFRILYPKQSGPQGQDPLQTLSMGTFIGRMEEMVKKKRLNITDMQVSPFEIGYEMIGGEGQQLAPKESIAQALDELLNAVGFPAELYKGSLSIQAFPVALRLFEKTWGNLVDGYNDFISWMLIRISRHFMWGEISGSLRSVTLADDIERKALALQAAAGMDISKATAYRPIGIDYLEEQRRVVEEQEAVQELQREAMERQEAQQFGGAAGGAAQGPGMGGAPGGDPGATPGDVYEQGKELAKQMLFQIPENMRRGELIKIKHSNPTLHAIVLQEMDTIRQEMARQGQAMMMEQQKMASADELPSPMMIGLLISGQIMDYNQTDLRKIATDVGLKINGAKEAFHWIYSRLKGWE